MENERRLSKREIAPLNTWDAITEQISSIRKETNTEKQIDLIIELIVNIRLLDKEEKIFDKRDTKGNIENIYARILGETTLVINSVKNPTEEFTYYFRELLKKLPIRNGGADLIGDIRSAAEYFEEGRDSEDPLLSFAGDLRKEVHRKLSPRILTRYIRPYFELIRNGNREPLAKAGYMAIASSFTPSEEDIRFIKLAEEMEEKLTYLWDYEKGNIFRLKENLASRSDLFEKCFLKKEMLTFLKLCIPEYIKETHNLTDCLQRLTSFKMLLRKSFNEGRLDHFDYLNLDLDIGRFIFIFTNDLTNNHYETIKYSNLKESMILVKDLLTLLELKGMITYNTEFAKVLTEIYENDSLDLLKTKNIFQNISAELQTFMHNKIFIKLNYTLNNVLEAYEIPTSSLAAIKDRFFNNFIRTTEFHAVNEFIEKIIIFLNKEIAAKNTENSLYGKYELKKMPEVNGNYDAFVATTWTKTPGNIRVYLGGKGNGLIDMCNLGVRIPPAFILGLPICVELSKPNADYECFKKTVKTYLKQLENATGKQLGNPENPLLLSTRSGTTISMPGTMCTILNVGLTPEILKIFSEEYGKAFAENIYLRFLKNTLAGMEIELAFEKGERIFQQTKRAEEIIKERLGEKFLNDPFEQLVKCIELIFKSSNSESAKNYLKTMSIDVVYGTAVTVQQMVFGNKNPDSMSGVIFTRNPINGKDELFGEYREMTQGEDVVMGNLITRTISTVNPQIHKQLVEYKNILERGLKHELDIEFTVDDNVLYLLQTRRASVSTYAKLIINTDMLKNGIIGTEEFKKRMERLCAGNSSISVPRDGMGFQEWNPPVSTGMSINQGITWGKLVLTKERLDELKEQRESMVYFSQSTKPSDFYMINNAHGIATIYPGRTSHAAITSITLNKPCVVGCSNAVIDLENKTVTFKGENDVILKEGEPVTLDANGGYLYRGTVQLSNSFINTRDIVNAIYDLTEAKETAEKVENIIKGKLNFLKKETTTKKKDISTVDKSIFAGKNILVRLDFNVPFKNKKISDMGRIDATFPTINYLLAAGATPILCSHLGDPGAQEKHGKSREEVYSEYSLKPVADYVSKKLKNVVFHEGSIGSSGVLIKKEDIQKNKINIIENMRFAIGEKENDAIFSRSLANLCDGIFVNDAFGTSHRSHASVTGVTKFVDVKLAGLLIKKELQYLGSAVNSPKHPFIGIMGGSKISTKLGVIERLLQKMDMLIVGGGIAYTLLKSIDFNVQNSLTEDTMLEQAAKLMAKYKNKILLPVDFVNTDVIDFKNNCVGDVERDVEQISEGWKSIDIGSKSINNIIDVLNTAETVLWNGPIGISEIKEGAVGTIRIAEKLAEITQKGKTVIIGGGDSAAAVKEIGLSDKMTHVSTGGGASLEFLERLTLPGISVLDSD